MGPTSAWRAALRLQGFARRERLSAARHPTNALCAGAGTTTATQFPREAEGLATFQGCFAEALESDQRPPAALGTGHHGRGGDRFWVGAHHAGTTDSGHRALYHRLRASTSAHGCEHSGLDWGARRQLRASLHGCDWVDCRGIDVRGAGAPRHVLLYHRLRSLHVSRRKARRGRARG